MEMPRGGIDWGVGRHRQLFYGIFGKRLNNKKGEQPIRRKGCFLGVVKGVLDKNVRGISGIDGAGSITRLRCRRRSKSKGGSREGGIGNLRYQCLKRRGRATWRKINLYVIFRSYKMSDITAHFTK